MTQSSVRNATLKKVKPQSVESWIHQQNNECLQISWHKPWLYLQINRPAEKNALNAEILILFKKAFDFIEAQTSIHAVIITGGQSAFCSGADLKEITQLRSSNPDDLIQNNKNYGELLHRIHLCRVPVISIVDGPALGGGMGLACASDLILATKKALFGMPEPKLGIIAGQILPYVLRKLGIVKTQEMALQGLRINSVESQQWGLINNLYENYPAMEKGLATILDNIQSCAPNAVSQTKSMFNKLTSVSHEEIKQTAKAVAHATLSTEGVEGSMAFTEKRKPSWHNPME